MAVIENNTEDQELDFSGMVKNAKGEVIDFSSVVSTKPKSTKKTVATAVPVKKKDQSQVVEPSSSASKSVSAPTKPSLVLPSKEVEKPEEVGYVEDLWNRFKGSGTKVLSAFLNVPSAAQSYIFDVALAATGKDEEFNRLPAAAKKEVKSAVRAINKGLPNGEFLYQTKEAANYLNKKAENIYQRTIQDETSLSDEISKLATNPTSEGVLKIINKSIRSTAESLPYMGISMLPGGAAAIGVATAAEKREQELEDTGNYGMGFLINSAVTGGSNYLGEKYTGRILNKIGSKALGNPELIKKVTQTPLKELGKDLGIEFTTGGLQSFTQEVSDKWTKGQDVEWIPTLKKALDDALLESASVGTFAAAGQGVSGTRKLTAPLKRYLATKIIAKEDASYIKKGVDAIQDLTTQKADDQDPIVNEAIDNKIDEIKTNIAGKLQMAEDMVDNLSDEDIKKTIQIDRDLEDVRLKAKAIKDNPTLDDATKETLRKDLANKYINLNQEKNAIQEQATSKISVQPEAGVSGEVAKGEPQAEPQGVAEEIKTEEVTTPTEEVKVEEVIPTETKPLDEAKVTAVQKGIDAVNKALQRGRSKKEAVQGGIAFMQKTIAYEQADDVAREQMLRDINKEFGVKEKKAPSAKKIVGQPVSKKVTVDDMTALKDQIKREAKAAKDGADFVKRITKSIGEELPFLVKKGSITPAQQKTIFRGLKANLVNPVMLNRFFDKVERIMGVADYKEKLRQANALRTKLSKASERKGAKTELKDITKALSKVQPNMLKDVDAFISRAKEALSAMSPSKVDQDSTLIDFKDYTKYTKELLDAQEKALQQYKEDEYRSLQEQGLINPDMSLADIEAYLKQAAEDEKFQEKAKTEKDLAEYAKASFENSKEIIQHMIDEEEISEEDLPLIQGFMLIDTDIMTPKMAVKAADELRNYIHNGSKTGMGKIFKDYLGAAGAKAMAENTTVNKVLSVGGIKNLVLKGIDAATGYVAGKFDLQGTNLSKWYSDAWLEYVSQIDNVGVTAMGEKNWLKFKKLSGFDEIVEGFVRNKKEIDRFTKEFVKKYENKKVDGRKVFTKYNATQAGIIADFYRETGDTPEEVAENFEKRKKILEEAIDYTKDKLRFKVDHKIMKELYDKLGIEKATNGQEVFNNAPKLMQDVVSDMVGEWSKYFPASQRVAEEQYGILLGQNKNYTPYRWTVVSNKISDSDPLYDKGGYVSDFDILDTEEAGTFKKLKFPDKLPTKEGEVVRIPNYNFFQNNIDALTQTGNNINTIAGVNQFNGFIKSKYMKDIIKDDDSRNLLIKRMTYNINKLTDREKISTDKFQRGLLKVVNTFAGLGTRLGLGAITSPGTQALPALTNTLLNLEMNPTQMVRSIAMLANPANRQWLDNLEETISERGKESTTSIDYAQKMLANKDLGKVGDVIDGIADLTKVYVDYALVKSDVAAAKISFLSYYLTELEKKGVDVSKLKLSETQVDKEAAKIADRKVQKEQNINIAELSGKLFSSKSVGLRLLRSSLLAFQSYTMSSRDKIKTNMSILFNPNSLSTVEEKIEAMDSIAATIGEQIVFSKLKAGIRNLVVAGAFAALGEEETEEEKKLREKRNQENAELNIFQALTGSFGLGDQEWDLDIINSALDYFQGTIDEQEAERRIQEQEEKDVMDEERDSEFAVKLTPEEKKAERLQRSLDRPFRFYTGGTEDDRGDKYAKYLGSGRVLYDVITKVVKETDDDIKRGGYYDKRGNFIEYNEDQIEKLKVLRNIAPAQLIGLTPSEVKTMTNEMKKIMKDRAYLNKMIDKDEERKAKLEQ